MRHPFRLFALVFTLPLAACFDGDIDLTFHPDDTATMHAVMDMGPEFYAMAAQSGDDLCPDGVGEPTEDGGYRCVMEETATVDELIEMAATPTDAEDPLSSSMEGMSVERLDGDLIRVSFDLSELGAGMPADDEMADMKPMLMASFMGHGFNFSVTGEEIVETNGTISDDGKTASLYLELTEMLEPSGTLPNSFDVTLHTGN